MKPFRSQRRRSAAGFTIVELLVALAISLLILTALVTLFVNQSVARVELDKGSRQIENGRYALQVLTDDVRHAGYYGPLINPPDAPGVMPDPCSTATANVSAGIGLPIQAYAGAVADPTPSDCLLGYKSDTAVLVIRRACTAATCVFAAGDFNIQVSGCEGDSAPYIVGTTSGAFTLHKRTSSSVKCTSPLSTAIAADIFPLFIRIYYVTTCSNQANCTAAGADTVPTLRRLDIKPAGAVCASGSTGLGAGNTSPCLTPLVDGIEELQFDFGRDTDDNGSPDTYTATATPPTSVGDWSEVMAVRAHLLARNIDASGSYADVKTYTLGDLDFTPGGAFKRHAYSELARLNNPAGRKD
jgi:type IV pilus assembly protein PilW